MKMNFFRGHTVNVALSDGQHLKHRETSRFHPIRDICFLEEGSNVCPMTVVMLFRCINDCSSGADPVAIHLFGRQRPTINVESIKSRDDEIEVGAGIE